MEVAREHSSRCVLKHRSGSDLRRRGMGENMAACSNCELDQLIERALVGWYDNERPKYNYTTRTCILNNWGFCSHYTQVKNSSC